MQLRTTLFLAGLALLVSSSFASAAPSKEAGQLFADGLRLYAEKKYEKASVALGASYKASPEQRTLFAWAQAERLSGHCDTSRELLAKYVANGANSKQSRAAFKLMEDCEPASDTGDAGTDAVSVTGNNPESLGPTPQPTESEGAVNAAADSPAPTPGAAPLSASVASSTAATPWYKDWVAVGLLSTGAVGLAVGGLQYSAALGVESEAEEPGTSYDEFLELKSSSEDHRTFAAIAGASGALLLGAGITYLLIRDSPRAQEGALSLRVDESGAGFALSGHF